MIKSQGTVIFKYYFAIFYFSIDDHKADKTHDSQEDKSNF